MLPLSKAVIATMVLFYAVVVLELAGSPRSSTWTTPKLYPVTVYLRNLIAGATGTDRSARAGRRTTATQIAANVQSVTMLLTVLPIICLYPFIQRYFVSGVMLGAVKQ